MISPLLHGGDVVRAALAASRNPSEIVDFSANINPEGLPQTARQALLDCAADPAALLRYPDWTNHPLRRRLAQQLQVDPACVVIGAGASALLTDVVRALAPRHCISFIPAFAEYRRASLAAGCRFTEVPLAAGNNFQLTASYARRALEETRADLVFINNPHNPSGALTPAAEILAIVDAAGERACTAVVDEAFIDYAPHAAVTAAAADRTNLIAVRSLTKFYGCPALRVGYLVTNKAKARTIQAAMPAWPVGTLALNALDSALRDEGFVRRTLDVNARERAWFAGSLRALGLRVFPGAANFLLLELPEQWPSAAAITSWLLHTYGLLVRDCSSFEGLPAGRFVRVAVLSRRHNTLLLDALAQRERDWQ